MKISIRLYLAAILSIGICYISLAQSIVTDRPDQTESAVSVPKGSMQIETGFIMAYETVKSVKYRTWSGPSTLFRIGVTDFLELRITSELLSSKNMNKDVTITGISDLKIGGKVRLFTSQNNNTNIAFLSHLVLPTGSSDLTENSYGTINRLAVSHSISNNIGLGYNIGYDYFGAGNGNLVYTLSLGFSLTDNLGVFVEGYGEIEDMTENYSNIDLGFTYLIANNLQYDFSFGSGINHYMNYISTGISWNIGGFNR